MKKRSQLGKEWAKVIAAGLITALILNSTVSLYAEENIDASPAPSTTQEVSAEPTPDAAADPTAAVPESNPTSSETSEQTGDIEEQPTETPGQTEDMEELPSETPGQIQDVEEQPGSSKDDSAGAEDEADKGAEVPTETPAKLPEESVTATPETSPATDVKTTPDVMPTETPKASPTATPEEMVSELTVSENLPGNLGSVEVVLLNGQILSDCELKVESSSADETVFTEGNASVRGIEIFEIHLENEAGEEVLLSGSCDVTVSFVSPLFTGMKNVDYVVLHKDGDSIELLKRISGSEAGLSSITFTTDSFSPFAVMALEKTVNMMTIEPVGNTGVLTTDLNSLLSSVEISGAETDEAGNLIVYDGKQYGINLAFKETEALQFNNTEPLIYELPEDVIPPTEQSGTFNIVVSDSTGSYTVSGNTYHIGTDGKVTIEFNEDDANYSKLVAAANVQFSVNMSATINADEEAKEIVFGEGFTKNVIAGESKLKVNKWADLNEDKTAMVYNVEVISTGDNTNIVVTDAITTTDSVLKLNASSIKAIYTAGNHTWGDEVTGGIVSNASDSGFTYTIPSMKDGEIIRITYEADIDYNALGTSEIYETNGVSAKSDEDTDNGDDNKMENEEYISYKDAIKKSAGDITETTGKRTIEWTLDVNKDKLLEMSGQTITDTIADDSKEKMHYSGDGITVYLNGSESGTLIEWPTEGNSANGLTVTRDAEGNIISWSYAPSASGKDYYKITYTTDVDVSSEVSDITVNNQAGMGDYSTGAGVTVSPDEGTSAGVAKEVVSKSGTEIEWKVTLTIPAGGLDTAVVTDTLPIKYLNEQWICELLSGDVSVSGLDANESYVFEALKSNSNLPDTETAFKITFYKDKNRSIPGLNSASEQREITLTFKTANNSDWVSAGSMDAYYLKHQNNVEFLANTTTLQTSAETTVALPTLKKDGWSIGNVSITTDGVTQNYPIYEYSLVFSGVSSDELTITDEFDTTKLKVYTQDDKYTRLYYGDVYNQQNPYGGYQSGTAYDGTVYLAQTETTDGVTFTVKPAKDSNGDYYSHYRITYYLIVKDAAALKELSSAAMNNSGTTTLGNTATWGECTANANVNYSYKPLSKQTTQDASGYNNHTAGYKLEINPNKTQLNGGSPLTVTDTMSSNMRLLSNTIRITVDGEEYTDFERELTTDASGNPVLTLTNIPDGKAIVIEYQARIMGNIGDTVVYSNHAKVTGHASEESVDKQVTITSSSTGTASILSINLYKHTYGNYNNALQGATFRLEQKRTGENAQWEVVTGKSGSVTVTTDADGKALIQGDNEIDGWCLYDDGRTYRLVEIEAPTGYVPDSTPIEFQVSEVLTSANQYLSGDTIEIANAHENFHILKTDSRSATPLSGAVFSLTGKIDGVEQTVNVTTTGNGLVAFCKLEAGTYTLREVTPPAGYQANDTEYTIVLDENLNVSCTAGGLTFTKDGSGLWGATLTNEKIAGSLTVTKTIVGDLTQLSEEQKAGIIFTVTGPDDYSTSFTYGDMTDGSKVLTGLALGEYTVTESDAKVDGYSVVTTYEVDGITTGEATLSESNTSETVNVTNTYTKITGSLTVKKTLTGALSAGDLTDEEKQAILFTITGPNGYSKTFHYGEMDKNGSYTVENLDLGAYTVTESNAEIGGYALTTVYQVNGQEGSTVILSESAKTGEVVITNDYQADCELTVKKTFSGAALSDTLKDTVEFTVTGPDGYTVTFTYGQMSDGSKTLTGLLPGEYTVTESNAIVNGYKVTTTYKVGEDETNSVILTKAETEATVDVTNTYAADCELVVKKTFAGDYQLLTEEQKAGLTFTVIGSNGYNTSFTYAQMDADGTKTLSGLNPGVYTVTEATASATGYQVTTTYKVGESATGQVALVGTETETPIVEVTNTYTGAGKLVVTKEFAGEVLTESQMKGVTFTVTGPNGYSNTFSYAEMIGGSKLLTGLLPGEYTVTETYADIEGYVKTTTYKVDGTDSHEAEVTLTGTEGQPAEVEITNTYEGEGKLTVKKSLAGDLSEDVLTEAQKKAISFKVAGPGYPDGYTFTYADMTDGSMELTGLLLGDYTITETNANLAGYTVTTTYQVAAEAETTSQATVTLTDDSTKVITVKNTYTKIQGSLIVAKSFPDDVLSDEQKKGITFTITGPSYPDGYAFTYEQMTGGNMVFGALDPGTYTVEESNANVDGYTLTTIYKVGESTTETAEVTLTGNESEAVTVEVINRYTGRGKLTVNKSVEGVTMTESQKRALTFTVTGPNGYNVSFTYAEIADGGKILTDLVPGEYVVTESSADIPGYQRMTTYKVNGTESASASATITAEDLEAAIEITNTYIGTCKLKIEKTFTGDALSDAEMEAITFKVTGPSYPDGYAFTYADMTNGSMLLENILPGEYTVSESNASVTGYTLTTTYKVNGSNSDEAKISISGTELEVPVVTLINNYDAGSGSLTVKKEFGANHPLTEDEMKGIRFTVTGPSYPNGYTFTYGEMTDGSMVLNNLEYGTYTVEERNAGKSGYTLTATYEVDGSSANSGEATLTVTDKLAEIKVINTYTENPQPTSTPEPTAEPTAAPTAVPTTEPTVAPSATPGASAQPSAEPSATPVAGEQPTATPVSTPKATATPGNGTPKPTQKPTQAPTVVPTSEPTQAPTAAPTATVAPVPSSTPVIQPTATPVVLQTPAPDVPRKTPERSVEEVPTPDENEPEILKPSRITDTGVLGAVRGSRRGLDLAVLGRRRRPVTGDSMALLLWIMALAVALGGNITSSIMLLFGRKVRR